MIENTSETRETLVNYTIPQLESMVDAIAQNNKSSDSSGNETLEDEDAMRYLLRRQQGR